MLSTERKVSDFLVKMLTETHTGRIPGHWHGPDRLRVAHNLERDLSAAFLGVTFSSTSGGLAPNDYVVIQWQDGPRAVEVQAFCERYEWSEKTDLRAGGTRRRTPWHDAFGAVSKVSMKRSYSDAAIAQALQFIAEQFGESFTALGATVEKVRSGMIGDSPIQLEGRGPVAASKLVFQVLDAIGWVAKRAA